MKRELEANETHTIQSRWFHCTAQNQITKNKPKMSKLEAIRNNTTPQRTNNASADGPAVKRKNKNIGFDTLKTKSMLIENKKETLNEPNVII